MAISDIFSSTFLISLAITFFVASMLYMYISNKFAEQNHKINSMFSLISTMAEEQQYFRAKLIGKGNHINDLDKAQFAPHLLNNNDFEDNNEDNNELISVSDNQDQEEYYDTSDSEYDEDEDENDNEYDIQEEQQTNNIDILNLGLTNHDNLGLSQNEQENEHEVIDTDSASTINLNQYNIKTIHLEDHVNELDLTSEVNIDDNNIIEMHQDNELIHNDTNQDNDNDTINTINTVDNHLKHDYKKMSLNKLREIIVEKGLLQDASKLKKNEILKMLGDE
jgi:hypothetical protein